MKNLVTIYKALADLDRLKIIAALILNNGLLSNQIIEFLNQSELTVSEHLLTLINAGIVAARKENNKIYYKLNKDSRDFGPIVEMVKNRMDNDQEFQNELYLIDEILDRDLE